MNEILARRYVKDVMRHGVSKNMAVDIVNVAMSVSRNDATKAINYALTLTYGVDLLRNAK